VHLDGARIWHAAVALGVPPAALTVGVDTVQVCFSKGLGAPVGSAVAGSADFVAHARRLRKMLGGGVRQGGVLAAAALVGLDGRERLAEDHERARLLVAGLRERGWQVGDPETNIVLLPVADLGATLRRFADAGVLASSMSGKVRLMPHADVTDADIATALDRIGPVDPTPTAERIGLSGPATAPVGSRVRRGAGRAPARRGER
jgi:threonine aldolase